MPSPKDAKPEAASDSPNAPPKPPRKRRRRRRLIVLATILASLIGLVAAAPTLCSMRWARSILLNRLNRTIDGQIEIDSWSLSWFRGARFNNIRINYDGRTMLLADRVSTGLSFWNLLHGDSLDLGRTDIESLKFVLHRYADGTTNLQRLLESRGRRNGRPLPLVAADLAMIVEGTIEFEQPDGSLKNTKVEPANIYLAGTIRRGSQGIQRIDISGLEARLGPVEFGLDEPIRIDDPIGRLRASGAIQFSGQLGTISEILENMGWYRPEFRMTGNCTGSQRLSTEKGITWLSGKLVANVRIGDEQHPRLNEKGICLENQIGISPADNKLLIRDLSLQTQQSGALAVSVRGEIDDWLGQRTIRNARGVISYNASRLPAMVGSLIGGRTDEELRLLRLTGSVYQRPFTISGRFPHPRRTAGDAHPLEQFAVRGSLYFASAAYHGLYAEGLELPIDLSGGHLRSIYADRPENQQLAAPAACNGGLIQLSGLDLALTGGAVRLSTLRPNLKVLQNVKTNADLLGFLGEVQPLFHRIDKASATGDLTIEQASGLPLGTAIRNAGDPGFIRGEFSLRDMSIKSRLAGLLAAELAQIKLSDDGSVPGTINNAKIEIRGGRVYSDLGLEIGPYTLGFRHGESVLGTRKIVSLTLAIPRGMIPLLRNRESIKDPIDVPLEGYLDKLQVPSIGELVRKLLEGRGALRIFETNRRNG